MENFLTWDLLGTFAGCVAGVVIVTELLKKALPKITPLLISYVVALIVLTVSQAATGKFAWTEFVLNLVNAAAVSLASNGGFDILKKAFGVEEAPTEELILDVNDESGTYLSLSRDPREFENGEVVAFQVTKIDSSSSQE